MKTYVVLCHYDGALRCSEKDPVFIRSELKLVLVDGDVSFNLFYRKTLVKVDLSLLESSTL